MGYESKVYIVDRHDYWGGKVFADFIAMFDLSKMGWSSQEFYDVFKTEIDYQLLLPKYDERIDDEVYCLSNEDAYGAHMKSGSLTDLRDALKICEAREHYRRLPQLIAFLDSLIDNKESWNNLEAVHYGY